MIVLVPKTMFLFITEKNYIRYLIIIIYSYLLGKSRAIKYTNKSFMLHLRNIEHYPVTGLQITSNLSVIFTSGNRQKWVPLPLDAKGQEGDQNQPTDSDVTGSFATRRSPSWRGVSPGGRGGRGRRGAGGMYRGGRGRQRGGGRGKG